MTAPLFERVLVANRGEIAIRVCRTLRELGIESVAVYSEADADAPHVAMADRAVCIGPAPVSESYLVIDRVIEARDLDSVDSLIATLSDHAHSYDAVTVSCVEVVVALHRRHIDIALQRIDELIGMPLENEHLGVPLTHGLGHILRTLQELIAIPVAQSEKLISTAARVRARGEAINTAMTNS